MAENDRFEKSFKPRWVKPYRLLSMPNIDDSEVVDALITPLAKTLREEGIPGCKEVVHVINDATWLMGLSSDPIGQAVTLIEVSNKLDDLVLRFEGHRHTKIAAEVAKSMIVEHESAPIVGRFEERACSALVEHYFVAIARTNLVAEGVVSTQMEALERLDRIQPLLRPQLIRLAEKLTHTPDLKTLRAPNRLTKKAPTSSLMDADLLAA